MDTNNNGGQPKQPDQSKQPPIPPITLPKGGGAIKGIEEKFEVNAANGTAALSFPLPVSPARNDFVPSIALAYNSGAGNGRFGLGWDVSPPSISRKTEKGLPQYHDHDESDIFLISGAEDLVPLLEKKGASWEKHEETRNENGQHYKVNRYRPRIEGLFARIERWENTLNGFIHWRSITSDNVTSIYGKTENSRIADPTDSHKIFQWLLDTSYDDNGNCINYIYKPEDKTGVNPAFNHEKNRLSGLAPFTNRYINKIQYGNKTPYKPTPGEPQPELPGFMFETVFDYGEHDPLQPLPDDTGDWLCREDPFSGYRSGFEIRTYRMCRRVLLFHCFDELGGEPCLVRSMDFEYQPHPGFSYLTGIVQTGYIKQEDGTYSSKSLPPVNFAYQEPGWNTEMKTIETGQLEHAPAGVGSQTYQWMDLYGEGIPGILTEQADAWFYKSNLGDGNFTPAVLVAEKPSFSGLAVGDLQVRDLEADGRRFLVSQQEFAQGYFEMTGEEEWLPFRHFDNMPNLDFSDPNLKFIDLNGDGRADILISEENVFCRYSSKGKEGYDDYRLVSKALDEEQGPAVVFADSTQSIVLADMSGDGLTDITRIRNGEIVYWPNLGYGKFGAKITMSSAPLLDHPETFNPQYIKLADLDGSGTTDLIYLGEDSFHAWFNRGGNTWSEEKRVIDAFPKIDPRGTVSVMDLPGNGTGCIVWSSPLPGHSGNPLKYIDLMDGQKPHLLKSYKNNMGKEVTYHYKSSTHFYLEDKKANKDWVTKLPFPVHCVRKVEVTDRVTNNRFTNEYSYHHGYYDHAEREFRGFGRVDQFDGETYEHFVKQGSANIVAEPLHQPPVLTRTWFHTGAFVDKTKILNQFAHEYYQNSELTGHTLPEPELPEDLGAQELREALRAFKGMPLRREIYSLDGSGQEKHPYTVSQESYLVQMPQSKGDNRHAVFLVTNNESITYHYERRPEDPRISHSFNLETDNWGNVIKEASVVYPRNKPDLDLPLEIQAEQDKIVITYTETGYTNDLDKNLPIPAYRLPLPCEDRTYELTGLTPAGGSFFTAGELLAAALSAAVIPYEDTADGTPQKRIIGHRRTLYLEDGRGGPLPLGQIEPLALKYETYQLAFTPALIGQLYRSSPKVDENMMLEAKYVHSQGDDNWWIPSGTSVYPVDSEDHFYQPTGFKDPFGTIAGVTYDHYDFLTVKTNDPLGNEITAENDYRLLQPVLTVDANRNRTAVEADELGMVFKSAVMGKESAGEGDTLSAPTTLMEYGLFNWLTNGKPNFVHASTREIHGDPGTPRQESYTYTDGSGNVIMAKAKAEPGIAKQLDAGGNVIDVDTTPNPRWVGNGRTILNNKGKPVKQYEPYFSAGHEYEDAEELVETGVTPLLYYDPPGRLTRTENPDGTFSKVEFNPWKQSTYDENDTVLDSRWYIDRGSPDPTDPVEPADPETRAAWLAAKHAGTPEVKHLDSLGRIFYAIADNGNSGRYPNTTRLDIEGNERKTIDARGNTVLEHGFDMSGNQCYQKNMDAAERWTLDNAAGNLAWSSDNLEDPTKAVETRVTYDPLQRPTHLWVKRGTNPEILLEYTIYGEEHPDSLSSGLLNLRGQIYKQYDGAGAAVNGAFDFKGNLLRGTRQLAKEYKQAIDWNVPDPGALLENEVFESRTEFDVLNRPVKMVTPHTPQIPASEVFPSYNEANLLEKVEAKLRGAANKTTYVENIDYDAKGRRETIEYGNGVYTEYKYNPLTYRLVNLKTVRVADNKTLQDLSHTYDPVGNITEIRDHSQQTVFFNNEAVEPHAKYEYDALYQLVKAKGREHTGQGKPVDAWDEFRKHLPHPGDGSALRRYTQGYEYDDAGNIMKMIHQAADGGWTRTYDYRAENNRLMESVVGSITENYTYDGHGSMTSMLHLDKMAWDVKDRFFSMARGTVNAWYIYDAEGQRVRKIVEKQGDIKEERIYLQGFEIYRKKQGAVLQLERESLHIMDDESRIALVETKTVDTAIPAFTSQTLTRYQFGNILGSTALELDDTGGIITYEEFYSYGGTSYQAGRSAAEVQLKRYRYTGKERDEETGFYYYGARYYSPWLCRWTACDPAGEIDGLNLYAYVNNNPVINVDRQGTHRHKVTDMSVLKWNWQSGQNDLIAKSYEQIAPAIFVIAADMGITFDRAMIIISQAIQEQSQSSRNPSSNRYRLFNMQMHKKEIATFTKKEKLAHYKGEVVKNKASASVIRIMAKEEIGGKIVERPGTFFVFDSLRESVNHFLSRLSGHGSYFVKEKKTSPEMKRLKKKYSEAYAKLKKPGVTLSAYIAALKSAGYFTDSGYLKKITRQYRTTLTDFIAMIDVAKRENAPQYKKDKAELTVMEEKLKKLEAREKELEEKKQHIPYDLYRGLVDTRFRIAELKGRIEAYEKLDEYKTKLEEALKKTPAIK
ncbi:MAG: toxin [bacterium]|nr:toxin [bacterium]